MASLCEINKNMEILLLTVGKTTQPFIKQGIEEYLKRLRHYVAYKIESIPDIKNPRAQSEENLKQKEGKRFCLISVHPIYAYCLTNAEKK